MRKSLNTAVFRFKPLVITTVLILAATSYVVASTVLSSRMHPTYEVHKVFQTQDEYQAFQKQLNAMPGVGVIFSGARYGQQIEADFKVTATAGFPYGTPTYDQNAMVVFPFLLCVLVLGTMWGLALQRKAKREVKGAELGGLRTRSAPPGDAGMHGHQP